MVSLCAALMFKPDRVGNIRALDLVAEFDQIRLVAIDQIPQMDDKLPAGVEFRQHNVNDGLEPFYGEFDVVHCRCVASGIRSYRNLLQEAVKCLRPGGIAIFIEGDFDLVTTDQKTIQEPASDTNPNGSWLQRWMQGLCTSLI
jgi:SAM-dependent methyltransferase